MANFNRIIMVGNLTRDPEYKEISSGQALCRLGLASNRQYRHRQSGDMVQEVCFIDIDVWGAQAESCRQYLQKGRAILVEGRLKFDQWQDNNGNNRNKHTIVADRVVFLSQSAADTAAAGTAYAGAGAAGMGDSAKKDPSSDLEKELLDQIDQIKEKAAEEEEPKEGNADAQTVKPAKKATKKAAKKEAAAKEGSEDVNKVGDVKFQDEPPFEDDLPF